MAHTIAIAQQKGGTAKTTTASALGAGLAQQGSKCLLIDLDAQGNLSFIHRAQPDAPDILDIMTGAAQPAAAIQHTADRLDIMAASANLAGADAKLKGAAILKDRLKGLAIAYDYIIIDTPPALGLLTINAFMMADSVIIPCLADVFSIQGTAQLAETIETVRANGNRKLKVDGILITRYNKRQIITRDTVKLLEQAAAQMQTKVFRARIRDSVAVREAQATQTDIYSYSPASTTATDYRAFLMELLADWQAKTNRRG